MAEIGLLLPWEELSMSLPARSFSLGELTSMSFAPSATHFILAVFHPAGSL